MPYNHSSSDIPRIGDVSAGFHSLVRELVHYRRIGGRAVRRGREAPMKIHKLNHWASNRFRDGVRIPKITKPKSGRTELESSRVHFELHRENR
jgi:hypothetical protein